MKVEKEVYFQELKTFHEARSEGKNTLYFRNLADGSSILLRFNTPLVERPVEKMKYFPKYNKDLSSLLIHIRNNYFAVMSTDIIVYELFYDLKECRGGICIGGPEFFLFDSANADDNVLVALIMTHSRSQFAYKCDDYEERSLLNSNLPKKTLIENDFLFVF